MISLLHLNLPKLIVIIITYLLKLMRMNFKTKELNALLLIMVKKSLRRFSLYFKRLTAIDNTICGKIVNPTKQDIS